jgi:hypothetical protein
LWGHNPSTHPTSFDSLVEIKIMTDSVSKELTIAENIFKNLVWDNIIALETKALLAQAPYLNIWPLNEIISSILSMVGNKVFDTIKLSIDLESITLMNKIYQAEFTNTSLRLKILAHDKGIDSPEFKEARENAKKILSKFISYSS